MKEMEETKDMEETKEMEEKVKGEKFAFISRHVPTETQFVLARARNIELVHVGDMDAFDFQLVQKLIDLRDADGFTGVVCVHPIIALEAHSLGFTVGIYEGTHRERMKGEKPRFEAKALWLYLPNLP